MSSNENVGNTFDIEKFRLARERSIELVRKCASKIEAGMSEDDGHAILKQELVNFGSEKLWHPSKVRFGSNTTKTFKEKSEPNIILKNGDVFFFDVGPVFQGHEGDYGETFVCGQDKNALAKASQDIYKKTASAWSKQNLRGPELYNYASIKAQELGLELNIEMDGHRLGDFPHALHFKGGLPDHEQVPVPGLWILEIHLRDPKTQCGSFFEDLLQ